MEIEAVKLLADLKEEDAQYQDRNQHVERDSELNDHRHAVGGTHGSKKQPIFHGEESHHLGHGFATRNHGDEREQYHRHRDADGVARGSARELGNWLGETESEDDDQHAHQHGAGNVEERLSVPVNPEAPDEPIQQPGQQYDLESQSEGGRNVQVILAGAPRQQQRGHEEHRALHRKQVDHVHDATLAEHGERQQQQQRGAQVQELHYEWSADHL